MSPQPQIVPNLIIGGGPAGSMLAIRLAGAGRKVTLVEKQPSPHHKVCGEFLSRETVEYLRQAGVDPAQLGAAPIRFVRLSSRRKSVEAPLPFIALSLSRRVLDEALLVRAAKCGCKIKRGASVESLKPEGLVWRAELRGAKPISTQTVFLASGKHDLRGWDRSAGKQRNLVGFKMHWRLAPAQTEALRECIELFLFPGGYGGLSLIEEDAANLCLVVKRGRLGKLGGWTGLLAALAAKNRIVGERLRDAVALWEKPLAVSPIPYGYLAGRRDGLWCVGDQAAVIPSFTGDGMAIALHSATLAAQMFLDGASPELYYRRLRADLSRGMSLATWLSRTMVSPLGRNLAPFALSLFPGVIERVASSTRIPQQALSALQFQ